MIISGLVGILLTILGVMLLNGNYLMNYTISHVRMNLPLMEGTALYQIWSSPIEISFSCYLFNVTNPDGVMRGEDPNLVEYGPFTYTQSYEKQVMDVDEEHDEIKYTTKSMYTYDKSKSLNVSNRDKVTILNPAYVGTISTLASLPPNFMKTYGDNIPKLFLNSSTIFLNARPADILFNGVKVKCNPKKYPELRLICMTLKGKPPPVLKETNEEGVYLLSLFQQMNDSFCGPFVINRGLKDVSRLADATTYKGRKVQTIWNSESCNIVRGCDTITYAPLVKPLPFVTTFIIDYCRSIEIDYAYDHSIHGLIGSRFTMNERVWYLNETQCYCPIVDKKAECLPQGLLDVSECQGLPIIVSEPHFLHGDPNLLMYARGLKPNKMLHETYIVIEPLTGTPLSGQKRSQVNLKLSKQPVKLLNNVSEGYFPILWCENGHTPSLSTIAFTYQILRLVNVVWFVQHVPLIVGVYLTLMSFFLYEGRQTQPMNTETDSILILPSLQDINVTQRPPLIPRRMFQ